ncbi:putative porin [Portibacter lacus]|uniref:Porin n=1 Tax=Portibacter lacus TaxID=1099794 RepID=A0AA37SSF7_9BACT|nr:putative porin [Portibacter lacus]GLR19367.1 hypothetical protein GCM10007940_39830 [Portibacter lacus]
MSIDFKSFLIFTIVLILVNQVNAQDSIPVPRGKPLSRLLEEKPKEVDSLKLLTYNLRNINKKDSFRIKGLDKYFQQYDPARNRDFDYAHLGNMGSAAMPMAFNLQPRVGFRLGYDQYALYQKTEKDITLFDQVRPFSELFFSGGETQADLRMKALFSRTFANDVNWVIDYDRISQEGIYENQLVKQTSFLTSLSFRGKKKLSLFFTYIINASSEEINGGITDVNELSIASNSIRTNVPVYSSDAESRLQNQNLIFNAFYQLGNDTIESEFKNSIQYQVQTYNEFFRFTDASTSTDSAFYKNYLVSERGIRNYNDLFRVRNALFLNSQFKDYYYFKTGVTHDYNSVDLSSSTKKFHEVYLTFNGGIQVKKALKINADFYYGLLDVANEFGLDANANLRLTKNQGFNFKFATSRFGVNYIQEKAMLNESFFYDIDMKPVFTQAIGAEYYNEKYHIKLGGKLQNTFNFTYYDTLSLPRQDPGLYAVSLLYGSYDIKYKSFLMENFVYLQNHNKELLNLPTVFTKSSISFYGKIFKEKMLLKAGLDFRYIVSDYLPQYNPVIGQFYLNESTENKPYPLIDGRVSFKVSTFTMFLKYENLTSFISEDYEFQVLNYPQFDARFRFGILWNLWN